ncbi:MAG: tRNA (adenine-N1)-methyltransferase [Chloroflexota bacterium]
MFPNTYTNHTRPGDLAQLVGRGHKYFFVTIIPGEVLQTHHGILKHEELIGLPWGTEVYTHLGKPFYLLQPSLADILLQTRRTTQIMYPKDIGFALVTMSIGAGQHILEAGTGSGAFTLALAFAVGDKGRVTTYENRPQMVKLARANLKKIGLADRVTFKLRDISEGFDETDVDACFLDLPNPHDYISQTRKALKNGGFFGSLLPTTNQVSLLIEALERENFAFIEVCETLLRYYKPVSTRLRPTDRMVAHTGYLIFARPIIPSPPTHNTHDPLQLNDVNPEENHPLN